MAFVPDAIDTHTAAALLAVPLNDDERSALDEAADFKGLRVV